MSMPMDVIRDSYVFEFIGLPEDKPMIASKLERDLVQQIEKFLLELGHGFMFVGTQQCITINHIHFGYVPYQMSGGYVMNRIVYIEQL